MKSSVKLMFALVLTVTFTTAVSVDALPVIPTPKLAKESTITIYRKNPHPSYSWAILHLLPYFLPGIFYPQLLADLL